MILAFTWRLSSQTKTVVGETEFSEFILKGHAFDGVKKGIVMELKGGLVL